MELGKAVFTGNQIYRYNSACHKHSLHYLKRYRMGEYDIYREHQIIRRRKMTGKVRKLRISLNGGNSSESVLHILEHLSKYAEVKAGCV